LLLQPGVAELEEVRARKDREGVDRQPCCPRFEPSERGNALGSRGLPGSRDRRGPWKEFGMGLADFVRVYRYLRGIRYPASKQQLVDQARSNQADEKALSSLRDMPEGEYSGLDEVSRVIADR
jgi:hypothetical protein